MFTGIIAFLDKFSASFFIFLFCFFQSACKSDANFASLLHGGMQICTANLQGSHANLHVLHANLYSYFGYANLQCVVLFFLNIYNKKDVQKSKKLGMQICNVPIQICKLTVQICTANLHTPLQKGCKICIRFAYLIYFPSFFPLFFGKNAFFEDIPPPILFESYWPVEIVTHQFTSYFSYFHGSVYFAPVKVYL